MGNETSKRSTVGGIVRGTRRASMGGGAILIGIVMYLIIRGLSMPGGGPGLGTNGSSDSSTENSEDSSTAISTQPSDSENMAVSPNAAGDGLTEDERKSAAVETLTILIDGHDYLLGIPTSSDMIYRPTDIKRIVALAQRVKGDSSGIKVRILRRESSRAMAEVAITTELKHVGIDEDSIVMPKDFVPADATDSAEPATDQR